jgi:hypothetical protein
MNDETGGLAEHALQSASWPIVQTDAGPVALATVQDLEGRAAEWRDWVAKALAETKSLRAQAEDHLAAAGSTLIARSSEWAVPANLQAQLQQAKTVAVRIASDDQREGALRQEESSAGFLSRIGVKHQEHELERDKTQLTMELRGLLIPIVRSAPATTIADAEAERTAAAALESQAASVEAQIEPAQKWADACDQEVKRRKEAIKAMGFDSLYEAADLQTSGAQPVESPLVLKSGEQAFLSVPATLARMVTRSHYVGGSSGFSFPIGHTGIRYRVGAFRGEPVHQQALTKLDAGTFVLTNQRVAYVGATKSTGVSLAKIMHVEVYNDGLSIAREGKENPDWYLMPNPKHAVFLLNWLLSKHPTVGRA